CARWERSCGKAVWEGCTERTDGARGTDGRPSVPLAETPRRGWSVGDALHPRPRLRRAEGEVPGVISVRSRRCRSVLGTRRGAPRSLTSVTVRQGISEYVDRSSSA